MSDVHTYSDAHCSTCGGACRVACPEAGTRVPSLVELLAEVPGLKVTFSPWCRSGLVGSEGCVCLRCIGARLKGAVDLSEGMRERLNQQAERQAKLLDAAYNQGVSMGRGIEKARHTFQKCSDLAYFDHIPLFAEGFNDHDPGDEHR